MLALAMANVCTAIPSLHELVHAPVTPTGSAFLAHCARRPASEAWGAWCAVAEEFARLAALMKRTAHAQRVTAALHVKSNAKAVQQLHAQGTAPAWQMGPAPVRIRGDSTTAVWGARAE
jgi:hypothetical protein